MQCVNVNRIKWACLCVCFSTDLVKLQPSTVENATLCGRDNGHAVQISSCLLWQ